MKHRFPAFIFFSIVIFTVVTPPACADDGAVSGGILWLLNAQDADNGTWGDLEQVATPAVVEALAACGESGPAIHRAVEYLVGPDPAPVDFLSRSIAACAAAGADTDAPAQKLRSLQNPDGGFGYAEGYTSSVIDSLLAARALSRAGIDDQDRMGRLVYFITARQRENGGLGFGSDDESLFVTARALQMFAALQSRYGLDTYIQNAAAYITERQNADGGFGVDGSTVIETATVVRALHAAGTDSQAVLDARSYLLQSRNDVNGSWNDRAYDTALAVHALQASAAAGLANLAVTSGDLSISPANPSEGQAVTIECMVHNTGAGAAENINVAFYRGDPQAGGVALGTDTIEMIEAGTAAAARMSWVLDSVSGDQHVYVYVDPDEAVTETSELDNMAVTQFTAGTLPDLSISSADMTFDTAAPYAGDPVTLQAVIANRGETAAGPVAVRIYLGDPENGGEEAGELIYTGIDGLSSVTADVHLQPNAGTHAVHVVLDPQDAVAESDEQNNSAHAEIAVMPVDFAGADLSVAAGTLNVSPACPREDGSTTVTAAIRNSGDRDAQTVTARMYDGEPGAGVLLGEHVYDSIVSGTETTFSLEGSFSAGMHDVHIVVDPENEIAESSEHNNTANTVFKVFKAEETVDIAIMASDIGFNPAEPVSGDEVAITCAVRNAGTVPLADAGLAVYDGDPACGGRLLCGVLTIPTIDAGRAVPVRIYRDTTGWGGEHTIFFVVDAENDFNESNEDNNLAAATLSVAGSDALADLAFAPDGLTVSPSQPDPGDMLTIRAVVDNHGVETASAAEIAFYAGSTHVGSQILSDIPPGESAITDVVWDSGRHAGTVILTAVLDENEALEEVNEFNNRTETRVSISAPDLMIVTEDIGFAPPLPQGNETLEIQPVIRNTGTRASGAFAVRVYLNETDNASLIGSSEVQNLDAGDTATVVIPWHVPPGAETHRFYVAVDADDAVIEQCETNNLARRTLRVTTRADLQINPALMRITPEEPTLADAAVVEAVVENRGGTDVSDVSVGFYDGDPVAGGMSIGSPVRIAKLPAGSAETVAKRFFPPEGLHEIYVVADPENVISDADRSNNTGSIRIAVSAPHDLEVRSQDIAILPAAPSEGDSITVSALVRNRGSTPFFDVTVRFFDGAPDAGGVQIGTDTTVSLPGGESESVSVVCAEISGGSHEIRVIVDPDDITGDVNTANNRAVTHMCIASDKADLTIMSGQLTAAPSRPREGERVNLNARIANYHDSPVETIKVYFYLGDPDGDAFLLGEKSIGSIPAAGAEEAAIEVVLPAGEEDIYAVVDPDNAVDEANEHNNRAKLQMAVGVLQGLHDDCGNPAAEPHLIRGSDTVISGAAPDNPPGALSASSDPESVIYTCSGLDPDKPYHLAVAYVEENAGGRVQELFADNQSIHGPLDVPDRHVEYFFFDLPRETCRDGTVTLRFNLLAGPNVLVSEIYIVEQSEEPGSVTCAVGWLQEQQRSGGGWPSSGGLVSRATAIALQALIAINSSTASAVDLQNRLHQRVLQLQATNFSWNNLIAPTCESVLALRAAGMDSTAEPIQGAVAWIVDQQADDGSWDNPVATGMAIEALIAAGMDRESAVIQQARDRLLATYDNNYWDGTHFDHYPATGIILASDPDDPDEQAVVSDIIDYYERHHVGSWAAQVAAYITLRWYTDPGYTGEADIDNLKKLQRSDNGWSRYDMATKPYSDTRTTTEALRALARMGDTGSAVVNGIDFILQNTTAAGDVTESVAVPLETALSCVSLHQCDTGGSVSDIERAFAKAVSVQCSSGTWHVYLEPSYAGYFVHTAAFLLWALGTVDVDVPGKEAAMEKAGNFLEDVQQPAGCWGKTCGGAPDTEVTCWCLLALLSSGSDAGDAAVQDGLQWLVNQADGGNGGAWETITTTALAILVMEKAGGYQDELEAAAAWLKQNQNPDGGWGSRDSSVAETAWALIALDASGHEGPESALGAVWLGSLQHDAGGWAALPGIPAGHNAETALAAWALSVLDYRMEIDLELLFNKPCYYPGDLVLIAVNPLDSAPGSLSMSGTLSEYQGSVYDISFSQNGSTFLGTHVVSDNHAAGTDMVNVTAVGEAGLGSAVGSFVVKTGEDACPDIQVKSQNITLSDEAPGHGDTLTVTARIENAEARDAVDVVVALYDGYPETGGRLCDAVVLERITGYGDTEAVFVWLATEGGHDLYVAVDPENSLGETNELNNRGSVTVQVADAASGYPDLSVSAADIVLTPAEFEEGRTVTISAVVGNRGASLNEPAWVRFTDGDEEIGGQSIAGLQAGGTAVAAVAWDTLGQRGRNYIHVEIDPQNEIAEAREYNNRALKVVDIGVPEKPDPAVNGEDIHILEQAPVEGAQVIVSATVRNRGTDIAGIVVCFYDGEETPEALISRQVIYEVLPFGGSRTLTAGYDTTGRAGQRSIIVTADPDGLIDEEDEGNNSAQAAVAVQASNLSVTLNVEQECYAYNEDVAVTAVVTNSIDEERVVTVDMLIIDSAGNTTTRILENAVVSLPADGAAAPLEAVWNTAATPANEYSVAVYVYENDIRRAADEEGFVILADKTLEAGITTDRRFYHEHEQVQISSLVKSFSPNYLFTGLTARVGLYCGDGTELYADEHDIQVLYTRGSRSRNLYWNTGLNRPGVYRAALTVEQDGEPFAADNATFRILPSWQGGTALSGTLSAEPDTVYRGQGVALTYRLANAGNTTPDSVPVRIKTIALQDQELVCTCSDNCSLAAGTCNETVRMETLSLPCGDYMIILTAETGSDNQTLAFTPLTVENRCPVARAGDDLLQHVGDVVQLDGSASHDPDGDVLSFAWQITGAPEESSAEFSNPDIFNPLLRIDRHGTYEVTLVVSDGLCTGEPDTMLITTGNRPPVAVPGDSRTVGVGDTVQLDGSASHDPDNDTILQYEWTLVVRPEGSAAVLSDRFIADPFFTADMPGHYRLQLVVRDFEYTSDPVEVLVSTENRPPVAVPGPDREVEVGDTVQLDGSASYDPDFDDIGFHWSFVSVPDNNTERFDNATIINPCFVADHAGSYIIQLIVHDGAEDSEPATCVITTRNRPPVAHAAGDPLQVTTGTSVRLDAGGSSDPDGDTLTFFWEFLQRPDDSAASMQDSRAVLAGFMPDTAGTYVIGLTVHDGNASDNDTVTIAADDGNLPGGDGLLGTAGSCAAFVLDDFTSSYSYVDGRVAAGGDVHLAYYIINEGSDGIAPDEPILMSGGNVFYRDGLILNGSIRAAGSVEGVSDSVKTSMADGATVTGQAQLSVDFTSEEACLENLAVNLAGFQATGRVSRVWKLLFLIGDGSTALQVFHLNGTRLYKARGLFAVNIPADATVIVNISGTQSGFNHMAMLSLGAWRDRVLFNFYEATDLNFVAADVEGSILAPWAQVDSYGGVVFGTAVAGSWSGPMSFVHMPFSGSLPEE